MRFSYKFALLSTIYMLVSCNSESHLDLSSFDIDSSAKKTDVIYGFIITNDHNPLDVPETFLKIQSLSAKLINQHWLENPNFMIQVTDLKVLLKSTNIVEANTYITALEIAQNRYLKNMIAVRSQARLMQRDFDNTLNNYDQTIQALTHELTLLETPEKTYRNNIDNLVNDIKYATDKYSKLSNEFNKSLTKIINEDIEDTSDLYDLKFSFVEGPHTLCSRYKGMNELLNKVLENCVYINKEEILSGFNKEDRAGVSNIINNYAPQLWHQMTSLNGFFDTSNNVQYFEDSLRQRLSTVRKDLRDKQNIQNRDIAMLVENYQTQISLLENQRQNILDNPLLTHDQKIDINQTSFVQNFQRLQTDMKNPIKPFAQKFHDPNLSNTFIRAYVKKTIQCYPSELMFTVSHTGAFSLPFSYKTQELLFDFHHNQQYLAFQGVLTTSFPVVIKAGDSNVILRRGKSLTEKLDGRLREQWSKV
ncbi:hypothetical protein L4D13_13265 [Photobacterium profundum]|uniref:hypothetical protein n=1 Tax=Photobacterium profundum TaxID=74109 RepID=UPI003D1077F1